MKEVLAAIDVGSNTILLLIAAYDPRSGLTIVEEAEDQPRLGAGLAQTGRLSEEAIERALQSLVRMRDICQRHDVTRVSAVATAAVREAENGAEFAARVGELGVRLRIISPDNEAELAYRSAAHHFPGRERLLVADIGGGSLELVGVSGGRVDLIQSLPLGAVRLTELGVPLPALREHIRQRLMASVNKEWRGSSVIGSGGTFANLAAMMLARRGLAGKPVHGVAVETQEVEALTAALAGMSSDERRRVPGLKPGRADIIVAGLTVITELLTMLRTARVTVSAYGIREGLILEMIAGS